MCDSQKSPRATTPQGERRVEVHWVCGPGERGAQAVALGLKEGMVRWCLSTPESQRMWRHM